MAKGDVPVVFLNSNKLKDRVSLLMHRRVSDEGETGGLIRYPDWTENWFYSQLTAEVRTEKGWEKTGKRRNEAFDLSYYALGAVLRGRERNVPLMLFEWDRIRWDDPPFWAEEWDDNELVFKPTGAAEPEPEFKSKKTAGRPTMAELAERLG